MLIMVIVYRQNDWTFFENPEIYQINWSVFYF